MADDALMPIGRFVQICGLSVHTVRNYDEVGLLTPAEVEPTTGRRRYPRFQIRDARVKKALRCVGLPIEEVRIAMARCRTAG